MFPGIARRPATIDGHETAVAGEADGDADGEAEVDDDGDADAEADAEADADEDVGSGVGAADHAEEVGSGLAVPSTLALAVAEVAPSTCRVRACIVASADGVADSFTGVAVADSATGAVDVADGDEEADDVADAEGEDEAGEDEAEGVSEAVGRGDASAVDSSTMQVAGSALTRVGVSAGVVACSSAATAGRALARRAAVTAAIVSERKERAFPRCMPGTVSTQRGMPPATEHPSAPRVHTCRAGATC